MVALGEPGASTSQANETASSSASSTRLAGGTVMVGKSEGREDLFNFSSSLISIQHAHKSGSLVQPVHTPYGKGEGRGGLKSD